MPFKVRKQDALNYHTQGQPGKIEVVPTKVLSSQLDLALAYSPGVSEPCKEIVADPNKVYMYTAKGNLVAVISNGTAVLGLGNIGPAASKPVMEGKGVLFKKFAGIDVFDLEIAEEDPEKFIAIVKALEPTFGGINLEDIRSPECFMVENELRKQMNIPVMHDDQHGTAIISGAGLINALELADKDIKNVTMVINGAGAAAISCVRLYLTLGLRKENLIMCDSKGVIYQGRDGISPLKAEFVTHRKIKTLPEALEGADIFVGLSVANIITAKDIRSMADKPIVFALANPNPEINYELACNTRSDLIMATGRSDYPNQINNVLGFPYVFRGALDVRATEIDEAMKLAAVRALVELTKEPVPEIVAKAYGSNKITFGRDYIIPKPLDPRLITTISPAVAKAAIKSQKATYHITDWDKYHETLLQRIGIDQKLISRIINRAKESPKRVVFAEADNHKILKAAQILRDEGIAHPILLGDPEKITALINEHALDLHDCPALSPMDNPDKMQRFAEHLYAKRQRKGFTMKDCLKLLRDRNYFAPTMVEFGEADAVISGITKHYSDTIVPSLQVIGTAPDVNRVAGMYIIINKRGIFFFADCTVNTNPSVEELVEIVGLLRQGVHFFDVVPRIAALSYSNFGSSKGEVPEKMRKAVRLAREKYPDLVIDGDIQANVALNVDLLKENYSFSSLAKDGANTFLFPNLASGNIAYKLIMELGGAEAIGPVLLGMNKPVHILQVGSSVRDIVNMAAIAVVDVLLREQNTLPKT